MLMASVLKPGIPPWQGSVLKPDTGMASVSQPAASSVPEPEVLGSSKTDRKGKKVSSQAFDPGSPHLPTRWRAQRGGGRGGLADSNQNTLVPRAPVIFALPLRGVFTLHQYLQPASGSIVQHRPRSPPSDVRSTN